MVVGKEGDTCFYFSIRFKIISSSGKKLLSTSCIHLVDSSKSKGTSMFQ